MGLRAAYSMLRRGSNLALAPLGISSDQYVLLAVLAREEALTQQDLVRRCFSDTATLGSMVGLLEARGLLAREPDPEDGRAWRVSLTAAGRALAEEARILSSALRARMAAAFTPRELRALTDSLGRLAEAIPPPERKSKRARPSNTLETEPPQPSR